MKLTAQQPFIILLISSMYAQKMATAAEGTYPPDSNNYNQTLVANKKTAGAGLRGSSFAKNQQHSQDQHITVSTSGEHSSEMARDLAAGWSLTMSQIDTSYSRAYFDMQWQIPAGNLDIVYLEFVDPVYNIDDIKSPPAHGVAICPNPTGANGCQPGKTVTERFYGNRVSPVAAGTYNMRLTNTLDPAFYKQVFATFTARPVTIKKCSFTDHQKYWAGGGRCVNGSLCGLCGGCRAPSCSATQCPCGWSHSGTSGNCNSVGIF